MDSSTKNFYLAIGKVQKCISNAETLEEAFQGSLPAFVAAFTSRKQLSDSDITSLGINKDYTTLKNNYTSRGLTCK